MKAFILAILAAGLGASATAQNNRVSLSFSTFAANSSSESFPDDRQSLSSRAVRILPVVGYHRMLNKKFGLGLELGYSRSSSKTKSIQTSWGTSGLITETETKGTYNEYYICPSVFSLITTADRKFRFIPTLSVPVSITPDVDGESYDEQTISGTVNNSTRTTFAPQNAFSIGLIAGGSAQYRVAGNFYAGIQLGAGFVYGVQTMKGDAVTIRNEGLSSEFRYVQTIDRKVEGVNFSFQPAITFNYFF